MAGRRSKAATTPAANKGKSTPAAKAAPAQETPDHGTKDISAQLDQIADGWENTEEAAGFAEVPDGDYQVQIKSATLNNAKQSGRLQVSWDLMIVSGKLKGRHFFKHDGLDTVENRSWFRGALARLGMPWPTRPHELPEKLQELINSYAEVTAKTKEGSDRQNVYFNKALDSTDIVEAGASPTTTRTATKAASAKTAPAAAAEEPEDPTAGDANDAEDPGDGNAAAGEGVTLNFTDADLKPRHIKFIEEQAAKFKKDYKLGDYDNKIDCLADIAEAEYSVSGEYDNPNDFIGAIQDVIDAAA